MSTPFYQGTVDIPGVDPGEPQPWWSVGAKFWLGKPEHQMVELPSPNSYTPSPSDGEMEFGLANGGSGTVFANRMRRYTIGWNRVIGRDWNVLNGFKQRHIFGSTVNSKGPWAFVPPEDVNRLTRAQSMCGAVNGVVEGWVTSAGDVPVYQDDVAAAVMPGGAMLWTPAGASETLQPVWDPGHVSVPDPLRSMPYLPGMACGFLFWAFAPSGTAQVAARISGRLADGTLVGSAVTGSTVTVGTDPAPAYVLLDEMDLAGSQYMLPSPVSVDGSAVLISNPIPWYGDDIPDWSVGCGVPRVVWPVAMGDLPMEPTGTRPASMVLAETIDGAA